MESEIAAKLTAVPTRTAFVAAAATAEAARQTTAALAAAAAAEAEHNTFIKNKVLARIAAHFADSSPPGCTAELKVNMFVFSDAERAAVVAALTAKGFHAVMEDRILKICCNE